MESSLNVKAKPLGKDQVLLLVDIIKQYKVITTKSTNATNNKLKDEAWKAIASQYSADTADFRRPEQLRLKWENLKKAARKRQALIRQNNLKTGGGKSYIAPDEALDMVASMLSATCSGYVVEFGGDATTAIPTTTDVDISSHEEADEVSAKESEVQITITPAIPTLNSYRKPLAKRQKPSEEAKVTKDKAMAEYFKAKAAKAVLEMEIMMEEKEKIVTEIEKFIEEKEKLIVEKKGSTGDGED